MTWLNLTKLAQLVGKEVKLCTAIYIRFSNLNTIFNAIVRRITFRTYPSLMIWWHSTELAHFFLQKVMFCNLGYIINHYVIQLVPHISHGRLNPQLFYSGVWVGFENLAWRNCLDKGKRKGVKAKAPLLSWFIWKLKMVHTTELLKYLFHTVKWNLTAWGCNSHLTVDQSETIT